MGTFADQVASAKSKVKDNRAEARELERKKQRAQRRRRRREARKSARIILVRRSAAYVSARLALTLATGGTDLKGRLGRWGLEMTQVDGYPVYNGRKLAIAFAAGAAGRNLMNALRICEVYRMDQLAERPREKTASGGTKAVNLQTGGGKFFDSTWGAPVPNELIGKGQRPYRFMLEKFFRSARSRVRDARSPDTRPARVAAWAAKDGDPAKGPAASLADCLPLEIGYKQSGCAIWIRHAPELSGE